MPYVVRALLLVLACHQLVAASEPEAPLPPKLDQAYRAYLAALAKAYQAETAKFEAAIKRESAAAKRDPELAAAIEVLRARVEKGQQLVDLANLVSGDLLDPARILGDVDALLGVWVRSIPTFTTTFEIKQKGTGTVTWLVNTTKSSAPLTWQRTEAGVVVTTPRHAMSSETTTYTFPLPLPLSGAPAQVLMRYTSMGGGVVESTERFVRQPDPVKPTAR